MKFDLFKLKNISVSIGIFFFLFIPLLTVNAQTNSYLCWTSANSVGVCDPSYAQQNWQGKNNCMVTIIKNENGKFSCTEESQECTTGNLPNIMNSINEIISGVPRVNKENICEQITNSNGNIDTRVLAENMSFEDGLTTALLNGTGYMFQTPPVEPLRIYAQKNFNAVIAKLNILDTASAQDAATFYSPGMGRTLLTPIHSIFKVTQDLSYAFLIIVVFFISLMILFRRELNGQQTINLMNSLPGLVLSIILITYSYGISGFFIDLIPIGSNFIQYVLVGNPNSPGYDSIWNSSLIRTNSNLVFYTGEKNNTSGIDKNMIADWFKNKGVDLQNINQLETITPDKIVPGKHAVQINDEYMSIWQIWGTANPSIFNSLRSETNNFNIIPDDGVLRNSGVIQQVASSFGQLIGRSQEGNENGTTETTKGIVQGAAGILIDLVFSFAALVATFRLFMSLLKAYLTLMLLPAFSPIIFLLAGIPSLTSKMINMYVKTMLSSALSFVAVYAVFLIVLILAYEQFVQNASFLPPLLGYSEQYNINVNGSLIKSLAAYGIFLMTPIIPQKIQDALQAGGDNAFGEAVSQGTQQGIGYTMMIGNAINQQFKKLVSPKDA